MKINKWLRTVMISCATALTFGIGLGLQSQSTQVEAATPTYKVVSTTSMTKAPYHKKSSAGAIWNASHT
ncbi:MAG: D-alanyl-D-alanine carboxypeptidase, partial [Lentilactobacillus hilgardii]